MFEIKMFFKGTHVETIEIQGSLLGVMKTARRLLQPKRITSVNVYREGTGLKEYML